MANLTSAVLDPVLASDPTGPRITYYDDATSERIELSAVTLTNWAAKTANLLRDEFGTGPADRVAVFLPAHWQTAAVLFGVWWIGAEVVWGSGPAEVAFCTRERLGEADVAVGAGQVAVLSLDPFGKPARDLPVGVTDYASSVRVHGDQVLAEASPGPALEGRSAEDVHAAATAKAETLGLTAHDRVLATSGWDTSGDLVDDLLAPLAVGASLVQVANPDPEAMDRRRVTEKVTRVLGETM